MIKPVEVLTVLDACPRDVFVAFVHNINDWWPTETHSVALGTVTFEPGADGRIIETTDTGIHYLWGHVTAWRERHYISLSWYPGATPDDGTDVAIRFEPAKEGQTLVTLTHSGWHPIDEKALEKRDNYQLGWTNILCDCFSKYVVNSRILIQRKQFMIREYDTADTDALIAIWDSADDIAHGFLSNSVKNKVREDMRNIYLPNAESWVIEEDGEAVGFISMIGTEIGGLFVAADKHRMGLGRQLVDYVVALKGPLKVEVFKDNKIGLPFYEKYGFTTFAEDLFELSGHTTYKMAMPDAQK